MKVLCSGDWHCDWVTDGKERFDEIERAVEFIIQRAITEKVDLVVCLGDLSNPGTSRAHRAVALAAHAVHKLSEASIWVLWISGNHDVAEDGHCTSTVRSLSSVPMCITRTMPGVDHFTFKGQKTLSIISLPFTPRSHSYDPAVSAKELAGSIGEGEPVIIAGHLSIEGMGPGSEVDEFARGRTIFFPLAEAEELRKKFDVLALNGHYHGRGECGGVMMPGSIARLTHGEEKNVPSFLIAQYKPSKAAKRSGWDVQHVAIDGAAKLLTIKPPVDGPSKVDLKKAAGAFVRVLPPAEFKMSAADCEAAFIAAGAEAAKVMPQAAGASVITKQAEKGRERVKHRVVVDRMVEEAHSRDRESLRALCGLVMDVAGM